MAKTSPTASPRPATVTGLPGAGTLPGQVRLHVHQQKRPPWGLLAVGLALSIPWLVYRVPHGAPKRFTGEVVYLPSDALLKSYVRSPRPLFESLMGNTPVLLVDGVRIFVPTDQARRTRPEPPEAMIQKGYSLTAVIEARPLLFGGFARGRLIELTRLDKVPTALP